MEGPDPVFSVEDRLVAMSLSSSRQVRKGALHWAQISKLGVGEIAGALTLLLVLVGFRRVAELVHSTSAQELVTAGAARVVSMVRASSHSGLFGHARTSPAVLVRQNSPVSPDEETPRPPPTRPLPKGMLAHTARYVEKRLDTWLMTFLGYKLCLLLLYTMPIKYGFGVKRKFLFWASKATLFRVYLRFVPIITFGLVGAGSISSYFSGREINRSTVQRWRMLGLLNVVLSYSTSRLFELIRGDPRPLIHVEETAEDRDLLAVEPPPLWRDDVVLWPLRRLCPPVFLGLEELPMEGRRFLFVGNHTILAIDTGILIHGLRKHRGIWLRPLGEHSWFAVPLLGEFMRAYGAVDGTRHNCDLLMAKGENLLVYPGGARESWRRTTDSKYPIMWGDHHVGFVTMAVRHGYTIVPVASVGTEDVFEPVVDLPLDKVATLGGLIPRPPSGTSKAFEEGAKFPLVVARLRESQRIYFKIMPPIETSAHAGQEDDDKLVRSIRDETRSRLQQGIDDLLKHRESDPDRYTCRSAKAAIAGADPVPAARL